MKLIRWAALGFLGCALIFALVSGFSLWSQLDFGKRADRANGVVVDLVREGQDGKGYNAVIRFQDRGGKLHEFTDGISTSPPAYGRGEGVSVLYDPANPEGAKIDGFMGRFFIIAIFGGLSFVMFTLGCVLLWIGLREKSRKRRLMRDGVRIEAMFQSSYIDTRTRINGRYPYRVVTQAMHPKTGKMQDFVSGLLWVDFGDQLVGQKIPVYINIQRPKDYHVDMSAYVEDDD